MTEQQRLTRAFTGRGFWESGQAEQTLLRLGAAAVPALRDALPGADEQVRRRIVMTLGTHHARSAEEAVRRLLEDDPSAWVRQGAAETLGRIGGAASLPALC